MLKFEDYFPISNFMSDFLGTNAEILIYDNEKEKFIYEINPIGEKSKLGLSISNIERKFIEQEMYKDNDYIGNYRSLTSDKQKLRASVFFIKGSNNELKGLILINYIVENIIKYRDILDEIISGKPQNRFDEKKTDLYESFDTSIEEMMATSINEALSQFNVAPERLSATERMKLIEMLDKKGTFLIKGSITELARLLNTTETTIYRYIKKL